MFRFQLEIAGFLAGSAAVSALTFWLNRKEAEGKIQLPLHDDGDLRHDPFEVTTATDLVHGYPIEESKFWAKVCYRPSNWQGP